MIDEEPVVLKDAKKFCELDKLIQEKKNLLAMQERDWIGSRNALLNEIHEYEERSRDVGSRLVSVLERYLKNTKPAEIPDFSPMKKPRKMLAKEFGPVVRKFNEKHLAVKTIRMGVVQWLRTLSSLSESGVEHWFTDKGFSEAAARAHTRTVMYYIKVIEHWTEHPVTHEFIKPVIVLDINKINALTQK